MSDAKYKICVYAICKNEAQFVSRWMDAVSEADMVVVLDTGSTDDTVARLREAGAIVRQEIIQPWRFDTARNLAMDMIPDDYDICVSNDLDEVFEAGWRKKLEAAWNETATKARYLFTWSHHADGSRNKQFPMEKIHCRKGYRWVHPVHEVLEYSGEIPEKTVWVDGLVLDHYPDLSKPRSQYLPLLELSAKENPDDDRTSFWLGREYMYNGMYDACIRELMRHLSLPKAQWDEERSASMRFIGISYREKGDMMQAKSWMLRAVAECPNVREPYVELARTAYLDKSWELCYAMVVQGLAITQRHSSYLVQPESWGYTLYDLGAISCYWLGLYEQGIAYSHKAIALEPEHERLHKNLALLMEKLDEQQEEIRRRGGSGDEKA